MFETIRSFFRAATPGTTLPPNEARFALGALLVRTAKVDRAYLFQELEQIDRILALRNGLNMVDAAKMRAQCELLEATLPDTADLTVTLQSSVPQEEREALVAALWSVVFADGVENDDEDALMAEVEQLLGLDAATCRAIHDREAAKLPARRT